MCHSFVAHASPTRISSFPISPDLFYHALPGRRTPKPKGSDDEEDGEESTEKKGAGMFKFKAIFNLK